MRILNKKYEKLAEPIFEKVNLILFLIIDKNIQIFLYLLKQQQGLILGTATVTEDEIKDIDNFLNDEEKLKKDEIAQLREQKEEIPEFWLKCFKNCDMIVPDLKEKDHDALKALKKIEYKPEEETDNFSLIFTFADNEFFTNDVLTKRFIIKDGDESPEVSTGTEIKWKEGKNLTKKTVKKVLYIIFLIYSIFRKKT